MMNSVAGIGLLVTLTLLVIATVIYAAPTSENASVILQTDHKNSTNISTTLPSSDAASNTTLHSSFFQRVGKFLGIGLSLGLFGDNPYPFGQPYPCTVYGYPAPYAPPGSYPCGYPYYFG